MAATSYTTLPSSSYVALGSQGDLLHSANYGTYDTGVGSLTTHPYQYHTTNYGTHLTNGQHQPSYSDDFLRSTYSNQQPEYQSTDRYAPESTHNQDSLLNDHTNPQTQKYNHERSTITNHHDGHHATANSNTTPPPPPPPPAHKPAMDNHHVESNNQHQTSHADTTHRHPPISTDDQQHQSQANRTRSEQNISNHSPPPPPPPLPAKQQRHQSQPTTQSNHVRSEHQNSKQSTSDHRRSPSRGRNDPPSATTIKSNNPPLATKTTKSSKMRAAAIKRKEETREQKHKDGNFPSLKKKATPPKSQQPVEHSPSDVEQKEKKTSKQKKKQSKSLPKHKKNHHDDDQTEDNNTSPDEDNHDRHPRNKSKKHAAFSDPYHEKYPPLPPVRRGRGPPYFDPIYDYPHRGRPPYYDDYPPYDHHQYPGRYDYHQRHFYDDPYDVPPYARGHHEPYDGYFDYEKRQGKSKTKKHKDKKEPTTDHEGQTTNETEHEDDTKSQQSKKSKNHKNSNHDDDQENDENSRHQWPHKYYDTPYYDEPDMLEMWRQERNDYLKKKFKPSIHDVLYAQQRMKSDSYLENQRRRALRDSQGYYFPYKKYTLKDYKDLQKNEAQQNPYAPIKELTLDRKERAKKRQEYAAQFERQIVDSSGGQQKTPRDMPPRKPWHLSHGEPNDPDKLSKRERALEYAKVQIVKHQPQKAPKNRPVEVDPTEQYVDSLFPQTNNDREGSANERDNQSSDEDEQ